MRAVCWRGKHQVAVEDVPEPRVLNRRDAIVRVTSTAICGSDLHLYDGCIPSLATGDILGHEFMGEIVEKGPGVSALEIGDRVVVPFAIACGSCGPCRAGQSALCDNSNPNAWMLEKLYGSAGAGLFGYSHLYGGYAGGQAEYVRVPFADVGPLKVPDTLTEDTVLLLSDILPTAFMAAERCEIKDGDTVAIWGCGPVGLLTIQCAVLLGAARVIAIDRVAERLDVARDRCGATPLNFEDDDALDALRVMTGGRGPDACIDAVGLEAHGSGSVDRFDVLGQAILACGKGGTVSIPGVYGGLLDNLPIGAAFAKGLTLRMGQTHVHRYMRPLLALIESGAIDPSFVVSHHIPLDEAPAAYRMCRDKADGCTKVVLHP